MDELLKAIVQRYAAAEQQETKDELDIIVCIMFQQSLITHEQYMNWASLTWDRKE